MKFKTNENDDNLLKDGDSSVHQAAAETGFDAPMSRQRC